MEGSTLERHACVINSIVGSNCSIGPWARVDGVPEPEQDTKEISVTVLATEVTLAAETLVRSCIVLPNVSSCLVLRSVQKLMEQKTLTRNAANQVLL
jgi:mannose-1-phosphate guanylyltransferase